jgi:hypothetical protein
MKLILILVSSLLTVHSIAQTPNKEKTAVEANADFEAFVNTHAISVFTNSSKSSENEILIILNKEYSTLNELGMKALENKAQYFLIKNTDKVLKIESLYRLRLMYQAQTKN